MPKQSKTDPMFRCNGCKEFHTAPDFSAYFQCAVHGYLCEEFIAIYSHKEIKEVIEWMNKGEKINAIKKLREITGLGLKEAKDACDNYQASGILNISGFNASSGENTAICVYEDDESLCGKSVIQYNWHTTKSRWLRDGMEDEEVNTLKKSTTDPVDEIRKYAKLRDDGLITEQEYQAKKKELLGL